MEKHGNIFKRHWGKMTAVAVAGGAVALAPQGFELLQDITHPESAIVAGVPGQVEKHFSRTTCATYLKYVCTSHTTTYYLGIEQCPGDLIPATQEGQATASFNPDVGVMSPDCYYDNVAVSLATWQTYYDGSTIVFDGPVGEKLRK